jgi:histidinol dehydrogenase
LQRIALTSDSIPRVLERLERDPAVETETRGVVSRILADVKAEGLDRALAYGREFDGVDVDRASVRAEPDAMRGVAMALDREAPDLMAALRTMITHVRAFAVAQRAALSDVSVPLPHGGMVGERWVPLERVGMYVPGGRAFYPSTLVMTVVPALVAGVTRVVAVTPPQRQGLDPVLLATAHLVGLDELYTIGGAQGIAWLAHGDPRVDLVAGPGNRFVAEAKRQLVGTCGIDSVAGPTEVLVLADQAADPARVAEDLLAQAEHDPDAAAVLGSTSEVLLEAVLAEVTARVAESPRREILEASLSRFGFLLHGSRDTLIAFAQRFAPEHLELVVRDPDEWKDKLTTAGALFVGSASAEAFGDYGVGPNHVLPTNRTARYSSPLGVATFMKRQSLLSLSDADASAMSPWVARLADAEKLVHHARSARLRG